MAPPVVSAKRHGRKKQLEISLQERALTRLHTFRVNSGSRVSGSLR